MEIKVSKIKEAPTDIPKVKTDDPICKEETGSGKNSTRKIFRSFTIATVTDDGSPVENALLDGNIKYATESTGVDTGSSDILSATIHARTADGLKETTLNWP